MSISIYGQQALSSLIRHIIKERLCSVASIVSSTDTWLSILLRDGGTVLRFLFLSEILLL